MSLSLRTWLLALSSALPSLAPAAQSPQGADSCAAHLPSGPAASGDSSFGPTAQVPPGWYSGETHAHLQPCGAPLPDLLIEDLYQDQIATGLDVVWQLYWGIDGVGTYLSQYAPLIDGEEHAVSALDPEHFMQNGVEVSQFASSQFGHQIAIGIDEGGFPDDKYPATNFEHFRTQPNAVTGYAHVRWYNDYAPVNPGANFHTGTSMGPVDAALGRIDFLEASFFDPADELDFRGMYYKLLNCGLRLGLSGGTDNTCLYPDIGSMRNWVQLEDGQALSAESWAQGLAAGRSTVSLGGTAFVDLRVNGVGIGDEVALAEPGMVQVRVQLIGAPGVDVSGELALIQDGQVILSGPVTAPASGDAIEFSGVLPVTRSTWLAVVLENQAHSGAVWISVDDRPMCTAQDAQYWIDMLTGLAFNLGPPFDTVGQVPEIQAEIADALEVFEAVRACAVTSPAGSQPYGLSTPACDGPIAIGATGPAFGADPQFALTCLHAPADASGFLVLGTSALEPGLALDGATLWVGDLFDIQPVASHAGGFAKMPLSLPTAAGAQLFAQYLWINPAGCGSGTFSASNALQITVQ